MIHKYFRSGDIVQMETADGPMVFRALDLEDKDWLEFDWDWPHPPEVQKELDRLDEL